MSLTMTEKIAEKTTHALHEAIQVAWQTGYDTALPSPRTRLSLTQAWPQKKLKIAGFRGPEASFFRAAT